MTALWGLAAAVAAGFVLALPLTAGARRLAWRFGLLDRPGGRKGHSEPMPVVGGVALFWAVALPLLASLAAARTGILPGNKILDAVEPEMWGLLALLAGAFFLHLIGLADDRFDLSPLSKLVAQILAILPLVLFFGVCLLTEWLGPGVSAALTVLWFLAIINAFNFLDGSDGLLGGVGAICAALLATTAVTTHQLEVALLLALLLGALLGFLVFNWPPARVYMGDGGSLVVGYLLAYSSVEITYYDQGWRLDTPWYAIFTPLVVLAIPLYDLVTVVALRLVQLKSPIRGDTQHFSHRLRRHGMSPRRVLVVICACTLATGMGGILLIHLEAWQALVVAAQTLAILLVLALLETNWSRGDTVP